MPYKLHLTMNRYSNRYSNTIVIGNKYFVYINRLPKQRSLATVI